MLYTPLLGTGISVHVFSYFYPMILQKLALFFLKIGIAFFRLLPFSVIHFFSNILAFLFEYVIRYRKKVVRQNLSIAFPNKTNQERKKILHQSYQALSDNFLETIKSFSLSEKELKKRIVFNNPELIEQYLAQANGVLILGGHFYTWEFAVVGAPLYANYPTIGAYKPLSNKLMDTYLDKLRKRFGVGTMSMNQTLRTIVKNRKTPTAFYLISDQSPSNVNSAHWLNFFNKTTGFLQGADKIARSTGYPVLYYTLKRIKRGYYSITYSELCPNPKEKPEGEITKLFAQKLEENIKEDPTGWLWTHKRWKRIMPADKEVVS